MVSVLRCKTFDPYSHRFPIKTIMHHDHFSGGSRKDITEKREESLFKLGSSMMKAKCVPHDASYGTGLMVTLPARNVFMYDVMRKPIIQCGNGG